MTHNPALDAAIRQARHLLFVFDGPIYSADAGKLANATPPTAPYIHEALTACRDSGRSAVIITLKPLIDVSAPLDTHGLSTHVTIIAASISDAISTLGASAAECLVIVSSPAETKAAQAAGTPSIGYAKTPNDAAQLVNCGAIASFYSMVDLVLSLRAH